MYMHIHVHVRSLCAPVMNCSLFLLRFPVGCRLLVVPLTLSLLVFLPPLPPPLFLKRAPPALITS